LLLYFNEVIWNISCILFFVNTFLFLIESPEQKSRSRTQNLTAIAQTVFIGTPVFLLQAYSSAERSHAPENSVVCTD